MKYLKDLQEIILIDPEGMNLMDSLEIIESDYILFGREERKLCKSVLGNNGINKSFPNLDQ